MRTRYGSSGFDVDDSFFDFLTEPQLPQQPPMRGEHQGNPVWHPSDRQSYCALQGQ
jgi:hypothetical protein